ncbi:STE/STE11/CDC15 protein kinase [Pelomyxa schiedti]|nr:STE/STE11/CDC15 protein kinase [Pelomyxa schiedti]
MFQAAPPPPKVNIKPDVDNDWDEAFDMEDIPVLHLPASPKPPKLVEVPKPTPKPSPLPLKLPDILDDDLDCFEDDHPIPTAALTVRSRNGPLTEALRRPRSSSVVTSQSQTSKANTPTSLEKALAHIQANTDDDSGSFDLDIGIQGKSRDGGVLELKIKAPVAAHDEAPEDDIFDAIETSDDEEDEEKERQKQEIVSKVNEVSNFEKLLKVSTPEPDLIKTLNSLTDIFGNYTKQPAVKPRLVKQGLMTYVQLLSNPTPNVLLPLLRLINQIITNCPDLQLSMAILGVIPAVTRFASTDFLTPVRAEVAKFVQSLCPDNTSGDTTLQAPTAQMFMSCSGPSVLVSLIRSYYADNRDIVSTGIDTIVRIFGPVQGGAAPNNDICRLFAYSSLADTIIEILPAVAADKDPASSTVPLIEKMTSLLRTLAQADLDVKEFLVKPKLLRALLPILDSLPSIGKLNIIKCFRGLSSSESLSLIPALQQAGLVTGLVERLDKIPERDPEKLSVNIRLEMLTVLASLCSLNSEREIEAVDAGIVPHLVKYSSDRVLRPPCIQLLVELPSISAIRPVLWKHGVFDCMLRVLQERGYMSMALECIAKWSETEKEPVSRVLKHTRQIDKLMTVFEKAEAEANIVSPLGRIIKSSSIVTRQVAHTAFVGILLEKMMETSVKAEVKIQLMQMLQHLFSKCSSHRKAQLIAHFSMKPKVEAIKEQPGMPKIVVRLAGELLAEFEKAPPPSSIPSSLASSSVSPSLTSTPELTQLRESLSSQNLLAQTTPGSSLTITLTPSAHSRESFQRHMHRHSHSTSSHNS